MTEYKAMVEKYSKLIEADEWNKAKIIEMARM